MTTTLRIDTPTAPAQSAEELSAAQAQLRRSQDFLQNATDAELHRVIAQWEAYEARRAAAVGTRLAVMVPDLPTDHESAQRVLQSRLNAQSRQAEHIVKIAVYAGVGWLVFGVPGAVVGGLVGSVKTVMDMLPGRY